MDGGRSSLVVCASLSVSVGPVLPPASLSARPPTDTTEGPDPESTLAPVDSIYREEKEYYHQSYGKRGGEGYLDAAQPLVHTTSRGKHQLQGRVVS